MVAAMDKDGAVVLSGAVSEALCDQIESEISRYAWRATSVDGQPSLVGTIGSLMSRSVTAQQMTAHPAVVAAVEAVLGRQLYHPGLREDMQKDTSSKRLPWRVHVDLTIPKGAGQGLQQLHRDGDLSRWEGGVDDLDHAVSVIWALDGPFTNLRGTTRVVLGSHHWETGRAPEPDEAVGAEMPHGSALLYRGRTYHGAGANSTDEVRTALNISYNSSFLKQECNTFVGTPPAIAKQLPPLVTELLGYVGTDAKLLQRELSTAAAVVARL
jgi:ectoine hydroxylase-related dioxygenase (phytanoyl-CoA dioxygenase family)